jgi:hypothetical protein
MNPRSFLLLYTAANYFRSSAVCLPDSRRLKNHRRKERQTRGESLGSL